MYHRAQYQVISIGVDKEAFYKKHPGWDRSMYALLVGNAIGAYLVRERTR